METLAAGDHAIELILINQNEAGVFRIQLKLLTNVLEKYSRGDQFVVL